MNIKQLEETATEIRKKILLQIHASKTGHPGGSLSGADILTYLYFKQMSEIDNLESSTRDKFVLSKGHAAPLLYATLAERGILDENILITLRKMGSKLQGHPDMNKTKGVDMSTGSLGQGISSAVGLALGAKLKENTKKIYTLVGDGELQEGQVWEAAMFAASRSLDNLVVIVDNNNLQIDGTIEEVNSPYPIDKKFEAFGFDVIDLVDGNDMKQIIQAFDKICFENGRPTMILAHTIKGKGVSFMENQVGWHGKAPSDTEYQEAINELNGGLI